METYGLQRGIYIEIERKQREFILRLVNKSKQACLVEKIVIDQVQSMNIECKPIVGDSAIAPGIEEPLVLGKIPIQESQQDAKLVIKEVKWDSSATVVLGMVVWTGGCTLYGYYFKKLEKTALMLVNFLPFDIEVTFGKLTVANFQTKMPQSQVVRIQSVACHLLGTGQVRIKGAKWVAVYQQCVPKFVEPPVSTYDLAPGFQLLAVRNRRLGSIDIVSESFRQNTGGIVSEIEVGDLVNCEIVEMAKYQVCSPFQLCGRLKEIDPDRRSSCKIVSGKFYEVDREMPVPGFYSKKPLGFRIYFNKKNRNLLFPYFENSGSQHLYLGVSTKSQSNVTTDWSVDSEPSMENRFHVPPLSFRVLCSDTYKDGKSHVERMVSIFPTDGKEIQKQPAVPITPESMTVVPQSGHSSSPFDAAPEPLSPELQTSDQVQSIIDRNEPWTDKSFARPSEILGYPVQYKRIREIVGPKYNLFPKNDDIDPSNLSQGLLGNCWAIAVLQSCARYPELIKELFYTKKANKSGCYELKLCMAGRWQRMVVDDYIPCLQRSNMPAFAWTSGMEMWGPLVEKAFVKMYHANYEMLHGGFASDAMSDLTGMPTVHINFQDPIILTKYEQGKGEVFRHVKDFIDKGSIMCVASQSNLPQQFQQMGIIPGHYYCLLDVRVVDGTKLVKMRNPWSNRVGVWRGPWSQQDTQNWSIRRRAMVGYSLDEQEDFWFPWKLFSKFFSHISICRNTLDWETHIEALSSTNHGTFSMDVTEEDTQFIMKISQPDIRVVPGYNRKSIGFFVVDGDKNYVTDVVTNFREKSSVEITLKPGKYYFVPITQHGNEDTLTVYTSQPVEFQAVDELENEKDIINQGYISFIKQHGEKSSELTIKGNLFEIFEYRSVQRGLETVIGIYWKELGASTNGKMSVRHVIDGIKNFSIYGGQYGQSVMKPGEWQFICQYGGGQIPQIDVSDYITNKQQAILVAGSAPSLFIQFFIELVSLTVEMKGMILHGPGKYESTDPVSIVKEAVYSLSNWMGWLFLLPVGGIEIGRSILAGKIRNRFTNEVITKLLHNSIIAPIDAVSTMWLLTPNSSFSSSWDTAVASGQIWRGIIPACVSQLVYKATKTLFLNIMTSMGTKLVLRACKTQHPTVEMVNDVVSKNPHIQWYYYIMEKFNLPKKLAVCCWYPVDGIKQQLMFDPTYTSVWDCISTTYRERGWWGFIGLGHIMAPLYILRTAPLENINRFVYFGIFRSLWYLGLHDYDSAAEAEKFKKLKEGRKDENEKDRQNRPLWLA